MSGTRLQDPSVEHLTIIAIYSNIAHFDIVIMHKTTEDETLGK